ncbi:MFS transporter [Corynebacterium incognita]|uniref:MFS transporter n=1 Tax=Corynebacterium incognita TaxID=2754725 RepID=A0A7G7CSF7_9CORY|nr:MFS transporter [Corynebacterium incognita]QNE90523.1 MFS transporter [Corynebacterium incognita]
MLLVGLATFSGLYCTQAILPALADYFAAEPTLTALTVSAATGALALCVVPLSILSERFGRGRVLVASCVAAALVGLLAPLLADNIYLLIALRGAQGALLAGAPAVAMTWLAEELDESALPKAMGLYIAGNSLGGLTGRIVPAVLVDAAGWRVALAASLVLGLLMAAAVWWLLPAQKFFEPKSLTLRHEWEAMYRHWHTPALVMLFITPFLAMGTFVSLYNYIGFRLIDTFGLHPALVGGVFLVYLVGTVASAQAGNVVARLGRGTTLLAAAVGMLAGLLLMVTGWLWLTLVGLVVFTGAFFALHSTASGWVGALATRDRAEASSMYVLCYYLGSSVLGAAAGPVFSASPWWVFILSLAVVLLALVGLAAALRRTAA